MQLVKVWLIFHKGVGLNPADRCEDLVNGTICNIFQKFLKRLGVFLDLGRIPVFTIT